MIKEIPIKSSRRTEFIDITSQIQRAVSESRLKAGICAIYVPHTTAAVTINENADPSVVRDISEFLDERVPHGANYHHTEGNADSHIKSSLIGCSVTTLFENGQLLLGTWQGIFFCEFDGPRNRRIVVKLTAG
jgi:secondary thiamine-phosphate synthase enzyme